MPRKKREENQDQVEQNEDPSDNEPFEWSDEENDTSSTAPRDGEADRRILSELAQHGFEVKGKLIDGKVSFIFRSPRQGSTENGNRGDAGNPRAMPKENHQSEPSNGERGRSAPPPYKSTGYLVDPHGSKRGRNGYQVRKHVHSWF
jgi:hypothetical protein